MATSNFTNELMAKGKKLPTLPGVAVSVLDAVQREEPDIQQISEIISKDPPLTVEVLKFVNSPYVGLRKKISSVFHASQMLGINAIKNLALGFSLVKSFQGQNNFDYTGYWTSSLTAAVASRAIAQKVLPVFAEDAFFLGLLHDIGILVMVETVPSEYDLVLQSPPRSGSDLSTTETQVLGFNHMDVGSKIVESWGFPSTLSTPIAHHHDPDTLDGDSQEMVTITRLLHVSTLFVDFFNHPEDPTSSAAIRYFLDRYGWTDAVDIASSMEEINRQVSDVLPIFQISDYDHDRYQSLIERAREELLNISFDTVQKLMVQKQEIEDLKEEVTKDSMTWLYNHRSFHQMLVMEMQRATRYGAPMSILMADIDNFKSVNDRYGHLAGDKVIKMVSEIFTSHIRETDIIGRYGGEEFAVICTNTPEDGALILADRLREAVAAGSVTHDGQTVTVTISIGVTSMEKEGGVSKEELIQQADDALYHAKTSGKDRCSVYLRKSASLS